MKFAIINLSDNQADNLFLGLLAFMTLLRYSECRALFSLCQSTSQDDRPVFNRFFTKNSLLKGWVMQLVVLTWVWLTGTAGVLLAAYVSGDLNSSVWNIARTTSFMCLLGLQGTLLEAGLYSNEQLTPAIHVIFMVIKAAPPIVSFSAMYVDSSPPAVLWTFLIKLGISGFMSFFLGGVLTYNLCTYWSVRMEGTPTLDTTEDKLGFFRDVKRESDLVSLV